MIGRKILSIVIVAALVLSTIIVINTTLVSKASATSVILSDDGSGTVGGFSLGLTCGEIITLKVVDCSLNASQTYYVKVWNGSAWNNLLIEGSKKSDKYGCISLSVHVPGWYELGKNPLSNGSGLGNGKWNISLFDSSGTQVTGTNTTITISNLFDVRYYYSNEWIDNILYNKTYNEFYVYVYNWTGTKYELFDDEAINISVYYPDGTPLGDAYNKSNIITGKTDFDISNDQTKFNDAGNYEYYMWINVSTASVTNASWAPLPVKLNVTASISPASPTWGDTITISGYVYDGAGNAIPSYPVYLYTPVDGGYYAVQSGTTMSSGRYSFEVPTGSGTGKDNHASAGTWYLGTKKSGGTYRIKETGKPNQTDFITYKSFDVATKNEAVVKVETVGDIISGFVQTINISVENASWMNEDEYKNMLIHVTGLKGYYGGKEYDDDDVVLVNSTRTGYTDSKAYYEFEWRFNESGNAKIIVSWPGNLTSIAKTSSLAGETGTYSAKYSNEDLRANITGSVTLPVVSAGNINIIVENMTNSVQVNEISSYKWQNSSGYVNISVYGSTQDEPMNATVEITGCGLNILVNESDTATENEYLNEKGNGWYNISLSPKTGGILTIKVTNETKGYTTSKEYTIKGLTGSVTTSVGDDKEITVKTSEKIIVTVTNGQYADVRLTLFDETWTTSTSINYTTGDNTEGNGLNGVFEFAPDDDYLDEIGYIVCAAKAGGLFMYDIVEITPVHDLTINITTPDEGNRTLTVGIPQDISLKITDPDGKIVGDIDTVTGKLYNETGKLKQTITFTESGDEWIVEDQIIWYPGTLTITAKNNTGEDEHDGTINMTVDLATFTFTPSAVTAGIEEKNVTVSVQGIDANGNKLPEGTTVYLNIKNATGTTLNKNSFNLDSDGAGEFIITSVGDESGSINITFESSYTDGNCSNGVLTISFPYFIVEPDTIYINQANIVTVTAYKADKTTPLVGVNLSFNGTTITPPEPVETDENGKAVFSIEPRSSGKANVTIVRNISWVSGKLVWGVEVITDTYITITALRTFTITVSKSPIYRGETLTVTVLDGTTPVEDANVEFAGQTKKTDANGEATFTAPNPGVESANYEITVSKTGYITATKTITVINKWEITIVVPSGKLETGKSYEFSIVAKGQPLAGATVTFNGKTYTSDGNGKVTLTMPNEKGTYTVKATYPNYIDGEATITVEPATPGFELITLVIAIGVAFILLRRRKKQ